MLQCKKGSVCFFVNKKAAKKPVLGWRGPIQTTLAKARSVIGSRSLCHTGAKRSKSFLVLFFKKELLAFTYFFNFWTAWELQKKKGFLVLIVARPRVDLLARWYALHFAIRNRQYCGGSGGAGVEAWCGAGERECGFVL
jgi:hypothetical protein